MTTTKDILTHLFKEAVAISQPKNCMPSYLESFDKNSPICILGAGKAAADMAAVAYNYFGDNCYGTVVTRYGYESESETGRIKVLSAAHPVPDEKSMLGGQELLNTAASTPSNIPVLFLISGGGSALAVLPPEGISLLEKIAVNQFLLRSGAAIEEMNTVRKHLSLIKGGRLAVACKSKTTSLVISDVVGDDPAFIASGMTINDDTTPLDALNILNKYHWQPINSIEKYLLSNQKVPKIENDFKIIANANVAIDKAIQFSQELGWDTEVLSYTETGEATELAKRHAEIALSYKNQGKKVLLFSGGELTVSLGDSAGQGGPNQEYLMALASELKGEKGISALAADTDGVDGSVDVAGGYIDEHTLSKAKDKGIDIKVLLENHDSFYFFDQIKDHIIVGPTRTNVNDFRVIQVS